MSRHAAHRFHDISTGHRVHGHEGKCQHLHGHNYRIHFTVEQDVGLDEVGRVLDFGVIKTLLCQWLEDHWDHKFLIGEEDPWAGALSDLDIEGVVTVPFNPTAENMGEYLVEHVGPAQLKGTGCRLTKVVVEETRKCYTSYQGGGS